MTLTGMTDFYLLSALLCLCFVLWPEETYAYLTMASLKIQVFILNYRMKFVAWRMYRSLCRDMKKHFGSEPPPFKWVDLWERDQ